MPTVPTYQDTFRPVALEPEFRQMNTTQASGEAFGAGVGRAITGAGQNIGQVADALAAVQRLDDVNSAKEAENKYAEWTREAVYGDNGFLAQQGGNAVNGRKAFEDMARQKREEFGIGLSPGAAQAYNDASSARLSSTLNSSIQHTATQRKAWFNDTSNARIETFGQDAFAAGTDHARANAALIGGINELKEQAALNGWSPETFVARKAEFVSGVTKNIVLKIASDDPLAADRYLKDAGGRLSSADRFQLEKSLRAPVLAAKANANVASITGGLSVPTYDDDGNMTVEPEALSGAPTPRTPGTEDTGVDLGPGPTRARATLQQVQGPQSFRAVAGRVLGMQEGRDSHAISQFVKNAAGINVDPSTTPWCAAFVNGVLGAQGIKGTGSLAAKSFLNFGIATDSPKPGDIVVFDRGGDKGHVGFFQGYDANGNIIVLGGNQGREGAVSISAQDPSKLLGFRTAGTVDAATMNLPNYHPQGLEDMNTKLAAITDPQERAATAKALNAFFTSQKKMIDAQREAAQQQANDLIMSDPTFDPMMLPIPMQQTLGPAGMTSLLNYKEKVRENGQPVTNDRTLHDLQTQFADDPLAFASVDLFQYRHQLSNDDWDKVNGWRQTARQDARKAKEEGSGLKKAFDQAEMQLRAAGVLKPDGKMEEADHKRMAEFQTALASQLDDYKSQNNGKTPDYSEVQAIIERLLLPVVFKGSAKGWIYNSDENKNAFDLNSRPDGTEWETKFPYASIPKNDRDYFADKLRGLRKREPTEAEVAKEYAGFKGWRKGGERPLP